MAEEQQVGPGLYVKLGMDLSQLVGSAGAAAIVLNQTLDLFQKFENYGRMAFDNTVGKAIELQEQIDDLSDQLGMTTDEAQKWRAACISTGTEVTALTATSRYLTQRLADQGTEGENLRKTLKGLGIDARDASGNFKSSSDLMAEILTALSKIPAGTERSVVAAQLLGRQWYSVAGMIKDASTAVDTFHAAKPTFTKEELENIKQAKIKMDEFNEQLGIAEAKIGSKIVSNSWITTILDIASGSGIYSEEITEKYKEAIKNGYKGGWDAWYAEYQMQNVKVPPIPPTKTPPQELVSGSETLLLGTDAVNLQLQLDILTNTKIPALTAALAKARMDGTAKDVDAATKALNDATKQAEELRDKIRDSKLDLKELEKITIPSLTKELENAKKTQIKENIVQAELALERAKNQAIDLKQALGEAATSSQTIADVLNKQGVTTTGTDYGGYSDLMNMTEDQLKELLKGAEYSNGEVSKYAGGKSQGEQDKAAYYLDLLQKQTKSDSGSGTETAKSTAQQATSDTSTLKTELDKQANLFTKLNDSIKNGWITLEKDGLTHFAALAEMARIMAQAELDYMAECVNFAGTNPIVQNKIIMSADGPDWTPPAFTAVTAPTLKAADFTGIKLLSGGSEKKSSESESESGGSGTGVEVTVNIENAAGVTSKVSASTNESLGAIATSRRVV